MSSLIPGLVYCTVGKVMLCEVGQVSDCLSESRVLRQVGVVTFL